MRKLSLRLLGHPSRKTAIKPWILNDGERDGENDGEHVHGRGKEIDDWMTVGLRDDYEIFGDGYISHTEECGRSETHPEDCPRNCPHHCDCPKVQYA